MDYETLLGIAFVMFAVIYLVVGATVHNNSENKKQRIEDERLAKEEVYYRKLEQLEEFEESFNLDSWAIKHQETIDDLKGSMEHASGQILGVSASDSRQIGAHLTAAKLYRNLLGNWFEVERTSEVWEESEWREVREYLDAVMPFALDELILKASTSYINHIASLQPGEMSAAARIEYAEFGQMFDDRNMGYYDGQVLGETPSGTYDAREAEQMIQQLLRKNPGSGQERLLLLLLRALDAQGESIWGTERPRGWAKKRTAAKARLALVVARFKTEGESTRSSSSFSADPSDDYGPEWPSISRRIKTRDGNCCTDCGASGETLHVHHIIPLSEGGTHDPENLVTLCTRCHATSHAHMS